MFSKTDLWLFQGTSENFVYGSPEYYAMLAIEEYSTAVRDNTLDQLAAIGKELEHSKEKEVQ
jgi:hypothetical protein